MGNKTGTLGSSRIYKDRTKDKTRDPTLYSLRGNDLASGNGSSDRHMLKLEFKNECQWYTPLGFCGWKRNEEANALVPCTSPESCPDYEAKLQRIPNAKEEA